MRQSFANWMRRLNWCCQHKLYVSVDDLPDADFYSLYEAGYTPGTALAVLISREWNDTARMFAEDTEG